MNNKLFKINISSDYELEFRIEDMEFINSILRKPNIVPISFEDAIITTYTPTINFNKYKYRSTHIVNSISSDKYERKELIYRDSFKLTVPIIDEYSISQTSENLPNPFVYPTKEGVKTKSIEIFTKYSRETQLSNINANFDNLIIDNVYRKLRISYRVPNLNFKIDLTCRYYPIILYSATSSKINITKKQHLELNVNEKQSIIKELIEEMKRITFTSDQVLKFENIDGYVLKVDLEFEYINEESILDIKSQDEFNISDTKDQLLKPKRSIAKQARNRNPMLDEYNKLMCFISNYDHITFSILKQLIPFDFTKSPQVNILTNQIINTPNSQNQFVWSEKMDGVRYLLITYNNCIYAWQNVEQLKYLSKIESVKKIEDEHENGIYIIDCEKVDNTFYIFDCYIFNFNDIRKLNYLNRLKYAKKFIEIYYIPEIKYSFKLLDIYEITDWNKTIDYALSKSLKPASPTSEGFSHSEEDEVDLNIKDLEDKTNLKSSLNTDGIVLHTLSGIDINKWPKISLAYKLKPVHLNTVDFLYKYIPSNGNYQLYLSGNYDTLNHALRSRSINDKISQELFNYDLDKTTVSNDNYFILFDCPYFENMWKYEINLNDIEQLNISDKSEKSLNNLIIESQYLIDEHRWQPIRVRYDKQYPNNYNVGLTNVSLIFDPPYYLKEAQNLHPKKIMPSNIESLIRIYIWDYVTINNVNLLPFSNEPITLIDYVPDAKDVANYQSSNITKIFAVSDSHTKLVDYVNALKDSYTKSIKHVITILNRVKWNRIYLNVFDKSNFNKQIIQSNDFILSEINMIYVNNLNSPDYENVDLDEIISSNIRNYCNIDAVVLYVYVGNNFDKFYRKYISKILYYFNPLSREDLTNYLLSMGISKTEIDKYNYLINCVILKLN